MEFRSVIFFLNTMEHYRSGMYVNIENIIKDNTSLKTFHLFLDTTELCINSKLVLIISLVLKLFLVLQVNKAAAHYKDLAGSPQPLLHDLVDVSVYRFCIRK